jgi:hypothetical protein
MRQLSFILCCTTLACQCLQPVDERPDAGPRDAGVARDAGTTDAGTPDAGLDAGLFDAGVRPDAGVECVSASDCTSPVRTLPFCSGGPVMSCVNSRCLVECAGLGGRTCRPTSDRCFDCDAGMQCASCAAPACTFRVRLLEGTCPAPFLGDSQHTVQPFSGRCGGALLFDGGLTGLWLGRFDPGSTRLDIPELGGLCVGNNLVTGVPRTLVSCPSCTFVAEGCE